MKININNNKEIANKASGTSKNEKQKIAYLLSTKKVKKGWCVDVRAFIFSYSVRQSDIFHPNYYVAQLY